MTTPAHRLTTTGRLIANGLFALALFFTFDWLPAFDFNWLLALAALAVFASVAGGLSVKMPSAPAKSATSKNRQQGAVKWFNTTKGFGFITGDDGNDIFLHFRQVTGLGKRDIKQGQRVSYVVVDSERGPQAEDVTPL